MEVRLNGVSSKGPVILNKEAIAIFSVLKSPLRLKPLTCGVKKGICQAGLID